MAIEALGSHQVHIFLRLYKYRWAFISIYVRVTGDNAKHARMYVCMCVCACVHACMHVCMYILGISYVIAALT